MGTYLITITFYSSIFFLLAAQTKRQPSYFTLNEPDRSISSTSFSYGIALWSLILLAFTRAKYSLLCLETKSLSRLQGQELGYALLPWIITGICSVLHVAWPNHLLKREILHSPWSDFGKKQHGPRCGFIWKWHSSAPLVTRLSHVKLVSTYFLICWCLC